MASTKTTMKHNEPPSIPQQDSKDVSDNAQILAQDPDAIKESGEQKTHDDHADSHSESDSDTEQDSHAASWWLDPSIGASTTISACLDLVHTSEKSALSFLSSVPCVLDAVYRVFILLPLAVYFSILSHLFLPKELWQRGGAPKRLSWPIRRSHNWTVRETVTVAVVSHLLPAFASLSKTRWCPSAERLIPALSGRLFGVKHQGWTIEGVAVQIKANENLKVNLPCNSGSDGNSATSAPPTTVLLWKSHARNVHHHQIVSFKPSVSVGGIGGGQARSRHERVILLLSGSSYVARDPIAGLLACNIVNLTGLRTLVVNWQRPSTSSHSEDETKKAFPTGLNDALQAYLHLTKVMKFRPENVYLVAQGSGAGVAMSLMTWLSALQMQNRQDSYGKPAKVLLWTPWCDLTMQSPTWSQNESFDIISGKHAKQARDAYVSSLGNQHQHRDGATSSSSTLSPFTGSKHEKGSSKGSDSGIEMDDSRPGSPQANGKDAHASMGSQWIERGLNASEKSWLQDQTRLGYQDKYADELTQSPDSALDLLTNSVSDLGLEHPLLSPGLPLNKNTLRFNHSILSLLHKPISKTKPSIPQYLILCGKDSVVWGESASLANNLQQTSTEKNVTFLSSLDTPTLFNLLSSVFLPDAQNRLDEIIKDWLIGDVEQ
ncbi:unnamed protein product [Sympodiomycopsis kandeliae]